MDKEATQIELSRLVNRLAVLKPAWHVIKEIAEERKAERLGVLVQSENPEARGAIKELNRLLELPEELLGTIRQLEQALADLPD